MADSTQMFRAGETHGHAQAKSEECIQSAKDTASTACDKTENAAQSTRDSAQQQDSGFLQQTGEKIADMTQGAVDSVKNTLGIGDNSNDNNNNNSS
ncbi:PREDICTED: late embryogenesis abundant protein 1-like [Nelumbo nucifera]|uniref:Late embryogenesis abundant protein 1-like n=2 Tax=Nelumbo nucifera TaxID=4432 RepID=A0A822XRL0_NELNU|nr:PREDICTED: late embryogenesis abundant protein 1-like [Nelumbo nucifera]DAD20108.1 TPA_asm: hypothetical protein HUJ06_021571 [Nelumbo nucifera]